MSRHILLKKIKIILTIITLCIFSYILIYIYDINKTKKQSLLLDNMSNYLLENTNTLQTNIENHLSQDNKFPNIIEKNERMLKVEELQKENPELVGWIEIPGTTINYPVMHGNDNEFYLNHNYKKEVTKSGSIFIDADYSFNPKSTNLLMYGHNMRNGTMFTSLLNYKSEDYYKSHPNIRFTTTTDDVLYEIIAAFESKVYSDYEDSFKYYNFINAKNEKDFQDYIYNIKCLTPYAINNTAHLGDDLITLSTCAYHTKDGRFAIVGKST